MISSVRIPIPSSIGDAFRPAPIAFGAGETPDESAQKPEGVMVKLTIGSPRWNRMEYWSGISLSPNRRHTRDVAAG
jgi:hypothetical protein